MKKLLVIANLYHASPRIPGLIRHMADFGWDTSVITVPLSDDPRNLLGFPSGFKEKVKIIETDYSGDVFSFWRRIFCHFGLKDDSSMLDQAAEKVKISGGRKIVNFLMLFYKTVFAYPDEERKWKKPAIKKIEEILKTQKFDAILTSSSPATAHIIGNAICRKFNIPWAAEFRDLWTQNHGYPYFSLRKFFEKKLEIKTLVPASCMVTVSEPLAKKLENFHGKKSYSVLTGFDPDLINNQPEKITDNFTITYTGHIYRDLQNVDKFLRALSELVSEKKVDVKKVEVRFYGSYLNWLNDEIRKLGLEDIVRQHGSIKRMEAIRKQRESQLLLALQLENSEETGDYSGKIFEYLASRRPILASGGKRDVATELLEETGAGLEAFDKNGIKELIVGFYKEYMEKGKVEYRGNLEKISKNSQKDQAGKLSDILDKITENR